MDDKHRYKLCRQEQRVLTKVQPIALNGEPYLDIIEDHYWDDEDYTYAIYENLGNNDYEDWVEYEYYGDDFKRAREEYKRLTKGE